MPATKPIGTPRALQSSIRKQTSPDNLTGLASPEIDQKLTAARTEADPAKRLALYLEAEQLVVHWCVEVLQVPDGQSPVLLQPQRPPPETGSHT